uniref:Fork-head domain-containing protein n=1 Tax=Parastrongyloides trichosuri TaxID=131310 RepID=A0A0N4ZTY0_PARTI
MDNDDEITTFVDEDNEEGGEIRKLMKRNYRDLRISNKRIPFPIMIGLILVNSSTKALPTHEFYDIICNHFKNYNIDNKKNDWKNLVRHNLSRKPLFEKLGEIRVNNARRKNIVWGLRKLSYVNVVLAKAYSYAVSNYKYILEEMINPNDFSKFFNGKMLFVPKFCHTYKNCNETPIEQHYKTFYKNELKQTEKYTKIYLDFPNHVYEVYKKALQTLQGNRREKFQRKKLSLTSIDVYSNIKFPVKKDNTDINTFKYIQNEENNTVNLFHNNYIYENNNIYDNVNNESFYNVNIPLDNGQYNKTYSYINYNYIYYENYTQQYQYEFYNTESNERCYYDNNSYYNQQYENQNYSYYNNETFFNDIWYPINDNYSNQQNINVQYYQI